MQGLLAANQYISSAGIVTVYLLMIVFAVLAFLVVVLSVGHKVSGALKAKIARRKEGKQAAKGEALPADNTPLVSAEEDEAVVAAITAAITVILESEAPHKRANFVVRKIERI